MQLSAQHRLARLSGNDAQLKTRILSDEPGIARLGGKDCLAQPRASLGSHASLSSASVTLGAAAHAFLAQQRAWLGSGIAKLDGEHRSAQHQA